MPARKNIDVGQNEWIAQFDEIFKELLPRADFYACRVKADKFDEWYKFMIENSTVFRILRVSTIDKDTAFSIHILTNHKFNSRPSKMQTYLFRLLWWRKIGAVQLMIIETIGVNELIGLKQSVGDMGRKSKFKFVANVFGDYFFYFKGKVYIYSHKHKKSTLYFDAKQFDMFSDSLVDKLKIEFYEKFIHKKLPELKK